MSTYQNIFFNLQLKSDTGLNYPLISELYSSWVFRFLALKTFIAWSIVEQNSQCEFPKFDQRTIILSRK
ncbi:MAG TPA: hypothetical protein DDW65_19510 [Firmicutes bacterium]|nr:hypothetical protein [Bacillota bacterium]